MDDCIRKGQELVRVARTRWGNLRSRGIRHASESFSKRLKDSMAGVSVEVTAMGVQHHHQYLGSWAEVVSSESGDAKCGEGPRLLVAWRLWACQRDLYTT